MHDGSGEDYRVDYGDVGREIGCKGRGDGDHGTEENGLGERELFRSQLGAIWSR